jgi:chromosome segregation ATPase
MPRVTKRKAAKDYPNAGIKKGDEYYHWKRKTGPASGVTCRSLTKPTPSQLNTGFAGQVGELEASIDAAEDVDGVRSVIEEIRTLGEEQQEKFDNMPEGLQQGDTGQLLEERASQCEEWANEIESACDEYDTKVEEIGKLREEWDAYDTACEPENATGEEVEEPSEERPDEDAEADAFNELKESCGSPF